MERDNNAAKSVCPLSREGAGIKRELRFRVVLPHVFCIEETPQPRDLRRQVYHDDLHLDVQLQPEDLLARSEGCLARRHEHVPGDAEPLQLIDHLAELGAPREHAQLFFLDRVSNLCKASGSGYSTHLSVLFVSSEQHIGRGLEGKVTHRILFDNARERCIILALMVWRRGGVLDARRVSK